ncbi:MAG TPA: CotH kinase family protein, partial [Nannocystis sp.]
MHWTALRTVGLLLWVLPIAACPGSDGVAETGGTHGEGSSEGPGAPPTSTTGTTGPAATTGTSLPPDPTTADATAAPTAGHTTGDPPPDLPPAIQCDPGAGGPYWLLEGESVEFTVACKTGLELDGGAFTIDPLPAGAKYDAATATLTWTPGLDQGAVYNLTITADPFGEAGGVKIGVADRWDDPANVPVVDPLVYGKEYGLPVLHLQADDAINADAYTPATVIYAGHTYTAEAKYRGAASLGYPKKSYTLKFSKDDKFNEPGRAGGFLEKRKVVLISTFDDNAYVRQRLAYELWNSLDPEHVQIQVYSGVVFLDGEYYGLYTFADHVDGYLMEDHGLAQDGNLYKSRTHDANFRLTKSGGNDSKSTPHEGLTKEEGVPLDGEPGAYDDLDELITFVATAKDAAFLAEIDDRIDRRDYEDWWIFVSLIMGDDSAGKNAYHYHDPAMGPWRYMPWDFNDSFGQTWQTARKGFDAQPDGYAWANELFARFLELPAIGDPLRARYGEALQGVYQIDAVLERLDGMLDETADSALRDEGRWATQYQTYGGWNWRDDFTNYDEEVEYLRQWI